MPAETAVEPMLEKGPSCWPLVLVLGFFLAAVIGAAGTTGAVSARAAHASAHHAAHQQIYLAVSLASSGNRP